MRGELYKNILEKQMSRKEFLQLVGSSFVVLFGFANVISLWDRFTRPQQPSQVITTEASHGFGSRKFGV